MDISPHQAYRAKVIAKDALEGAEAKQYENLYHYAKTIREKYDGSCVKILGEAFQEGGLAHFKRMYVRYHAQKAGFLAGCRPIIGLDACHLKGRFGGQLIAAIARDGNNNMFPLAIAIVEQENKESWAWFMECFIEDFGNPRELGLVFVSDRQKVCFLC